MAEIINCNKVTAVLQQHGEWSEIEHGTSSSIPGRTICPVTPEPTHLHGKAAVPV